MRFIFFVIDFLVIAAGLLLAWVLYELGVEREKLRKQKKNSEGGENK